MTIIECKDHVSKIPVKLIDELHSKMQDVNANKAVLVSRMGFTDGAKKKAKRLGISLCTAHSAAKEEWKFRLSIPIILIEDSCESFEISTIFTAISWRSMGRGSIIWDTLGWTI